MDIYTNGKNNLEDELAKRLAEMCKELLEIQVELSPEDAKLLRDNLWELY